MQEVPHFNEIKRAAGFGLVLVLILQLLRGVNGVDSFHESPTNSSASGLLALNYPNQRIGPYDWRYFRVEVPSAFSKLSVTLTRKWTGEQNGDQTAKVPMVCFRFGAPPFPGPASESPQAAAEAAGRSYNTSDTGQCAWFLNTSSVLLTTNQVAAGVWYLGVFSDTLPSRFQSKMMSHRKLYSFGVQVTVSGCKLPSRTGRDCNASITHLCTETAPLPDLNSGESLSELPPQPLVEFGQTLFHSDNVQKATKSATNTEDLSALDEALADAEKQIIASGGQTGPSIKQVHRKTLEGGDSWSSLPKQSVGAGTWRYYALEISQFASNLEVRFDCMLPDCGLQSVKNGTETVARLHLRYGALPDEATSDVSANAGSAPLSIAAPRRGQWFMGVSNPNVTVPLEFSLHWCLRSCPPGTAGVDCRWMTNSLERVLVEDTYESPFDSYYSPAQGSPLHSPWFPISSSPAANNTSGNWAYYVVEVPRGAAGAVLSLELRHAASVTAELYARIEGFPTLDHWDVRATNLKAQSNRGAGRSSRLETQKQLGHSGKSGKVSLHMVYPVEGIWCVGIHYLSSAVSSSSISAEESIPYQLGFFDRIYMKLKKSWDGFVGRLYQTVRFAVDKSSLVKHQTVTGVETSMLSGSEPCKGVCSEQRVVSVGGLYDGIKTAASPEERSSMVDNLDLITQTQKTEMEDGLVEEPLASFISPMTGSVREAVDAVAGERQETGVEMQITIHGCPNQCSRRGNCQTAYDASRLHYYRSSFTPKVIISADKIFDPLNRCIEKSYEQDDVRKLVWGINFLLVASLMMIPMSSLIVHCKTASGGQDTGLKVMIGICSACHCDTSHGGYDCSIALVVPLEEAVHIWSLIGSNLAAILPSAWAIRHHLYWLPNSILQGTCNGSEVSLCWQSFAHSEWVAYTSSGIASAIYHSCDAGGWCALSYDTLQFLDFWLAFLVVVMTCLYIVSLKQATKPVAHLGAAIITATFIKESAASAWNILLVVLLGTAGLVLGWALECWRLHLVPAWLDPLQHIVGFTAMYGRGERFVSRLKGRVQWRYVIAGLGILVAAALSWAMETDSTYWIWHSLWHVSIYTSTFVILCSTTTSPQLREADAAGGYERVLSQCRGPESPPILRHTVELDAFADEDDRG